MNSDELARYQRHFSLPQVGLEGQRKLKKASVLAVGTGGLGSPVSLYLAAAGIGRLGLVDFDRVDSSNLQRQLLHGTADLGRPKTESARRRLADLNPHVEVISYPQALTSQNALEILADYDLVVDGSDNFPTRYLVNDACVLLDKPYVYGSVFRFEGQVSVFPGRPCYRCLYPEPPPPALAPSCAEGGVLGVLPGVVGTLQATEAIKWLLGIGKPLVGRLMTFDALAMRFLELRFHADPGCSVCGPKPSITELIDYPQFCAQGAPQVSPFEFRAQWEAGRRPTLIDVRGPQEWESDNLAEYGACLVPLASLEERLQEFDPSDDIVVHCRSGVRSAQAQKTMMEAGFTQVRNLSGGILAWRNESSRNVNKS